MVGVIVGGQDVLTVCSCRTPNVPSCTTWSVKVATRANLSALSISVKTLYLRWAGVFDSHLQWALIIYYCFQDSKRAFLHECVNEEGDKEKLDAFVNFCEDTIFEVENRSLWQGVLPVSQSTNPLSCRNELRVIYLYSHWDMHGLSCCPSFLVCHPVKFHPVTIRNRRDTLMMLWYHIPY